MFRGLLRDVFIRKKLLPFEQYPNIFGEANLREKTKLSYGVVGLEILNVKEHNICL
jgi:hypothetical protein